MSPQKDQSFLGTRETTRRAMQHFADSSLSDSILFLRSKEGGG